MQSDIIKNMRCSFITHTHTHTLTLSHKEVMLALGAQGVAQRSHFGGKCGMRGNVKANL